MDEEVDGFAHLLSQPLQRRRPRGVATQHGRPRPVWMRHHALRYMYTVAVSEDRRHEPAVQRLVCGSPAGDRRLKR